MLSLDSKMTKEFYLFEIADGTNKGVSKSLKNNFHFENCRCLMNYCWKKNQEITGIFSMDYAYEGPFSGAFLLPAIWRSLHVNPSSQKERD